MDFTVAEWDNSRGAFVTRQMTALEIAEVQARIASAPPPVPQSVPMLNAHLVLIAEGKMQLLKTLVAGLPDTDRMEAEAYLNLALTCRRDNKWVVQLGPGLGYDQAGLDQLFIRANAITP